jgi:hypothetical protein
MPSNHKVAYTPLDIDHGNVEFSRGINNYSLRRNMGMTSLQAALWAAIALLMADSIIELSFISSMVSWLHRRAGGSFDVNYNSSTFSLHGKPAGLLLNQGHTSNGAAGTAFVLIGMGGILALLLRNHAIRHPGTGLSKFGLGWYHAWLVFTVLSAFLTMSALIYVFVINNDHKGQSIDLSLASTLNNQPYPNYVAYPLDFWTPVNWFQAVLQLDLDSSADRSNIHNHLAIMRGWAWNLIPMFIIGLAVVALAFADAVQRQAEMRRGRESSAYAGREGKRLSA